VGQVSLHNSKTEWVCEESVRLPKESTVADLLALLAQQLQVSVNIRPTTFLRRISTEREYGSGIHGVELQGNEKVAEKRGLYSTRGGTGLQPTPTRPLRLMEVCYQRIFKIFKGDDPIADINDQYWQLRVEEIPEEDELLGPGDRIINVHHFKVDPASTVHVVRTRIRCLRLHPRLSIRSRALTRAPGGSVL